MVVDHVMVRRTKHLHHFDERPHLHLEPSLLTKLTRNGDVSLTIASTISIAAASAGVGVATANRAS